MSYYSTSKVQPVQHGHFARFPGSYSTYKVIRNTVQNPYNKHKFIANHTGASHVIKNVTHFVADAKPHIPLVPSKYSVNNLKSRINPKTTISSSPRTLNSSTIHTIPISGKSVVSLLGKNYSNPCQKPFIKSQSFLNNKSTNLTHNCVGPKSVKLLQDAPNLPHATSKYAITGKKNSIAVVSKSPNEIMPEILSKLNECRTLLEKFVPEPKNVSSRNRPGLQHSTHTVYFDNNLPHSTKLPVTVNTKAKDHFKKLTNINMSQYKLKKSVVNTRNSPFRQIPSLRARNLQTKYKIVNEKRSAKPSICKTTPMKATTIASVTNTRFKVVNPMSSKCVYSNTSQKCIVNIELKHNSIKSSPLLNKIGNETIIKAPQKYSVKRKSLTSSIAKKKVIKPRPLTLKEKINKLKVIKSVDYEGLDLEHISPDELVSMDANSLLHLSELVKSSCDTKHKSFITKSKYKIVAKKSATREAAKMVKAKYKATKSPQPKLSISYGTSKKWKAWNSNVRYARNKQSSLRSQSYYSTAVHHRRYAGYAKSSQHQYKKCGLRNNRYKKTNFIMIGNIPYRVSRTKVTKQPKALHKGNKRLNSSAVLVIRGIKFKMDPTGKSLKRVSNITDTQRKMPFKRIDIGGKTFIGTERGDFTATSSSQIRNVASRKLSRSIKTICATKKTYSKQNTFCMFYNRFGKCNRGAECPYLHDPSKIAVCTRFLRGTCKREDCPFSHKRNPGNMAICAFFLQGSCTSKDCPYRHEEINPGAEICKPFVHGYCAKGIKCKNVHVLACPQYMTGQCPKGKDCSFPHPEKMKRKNQTDHKEEDRKKVNLQTEDNTESNDVRYFYKTTADESCSKTICIPSRQKSVLLPEYIPL